MDELIVSYVVEEEIVHYGTPRRSGRYPWGSGDNPMQRGNKDFLGYVNDMRRQGISDPDIAEGLGLESSTQLRARISMAKTAKRQSDQAQVMRLKDKGVGNAAIGRQLGIPESSVRALADPALKQRLDQLETTASFLKDQVGKDGFLDIGAGTENWRGISATKLNTAVAILKEQGYVVRNVYVPQQFGKGKTTVKTLCPPGWEKGYIDPTKIKTVGAYTDEKGNLTRVEPPVMMSSKRIGVRFGGEGGEKADGVIYVRPGVEDVSLGGSRYLQVRIGVDGTHYLKGMAMYKDDLPDGVDILFNTSKPRTANKLDVMKPIEPEEDRPFKISMITAQRHYTDAQGNRRLSPINVVNEEGDWSDWHPTLSSQFLSKQPIALAKRQLDFALTDRENEFNEIMSLTNPVVKKKLLTMFGDETDSAAVHLKAAAMPKQKTAVLLPFPGMNEHQIYAPNYPDGTRVVLIRHPHGGTFEIPELVVNNKYAPARKVLGPGAAGVPHAALDAVGIHPNVAKRLSGADFDGDAVLVIPNTRNEIRISPALKGLQDFDPSREYPGYPGMPVINGRAKQQQMGDVSNLITDMTIKGASHDEIAKAVRHSMVVIDAEKHGLDVKRSYDENGIRELKAKYQGIKNNRVAGASTLISRAKSPERIVQRRPLPARKGGPIDPATGKKLWEPTGRTYVNKQGVRVPVKIKSKKLAETEDARTLISNENTPIEQIYAAHSNSLKALANRARLESLRTGKIQYSPAAARTYKAEVDRLNAALNLAKKNAPLERQAQIITNAMVSARIHDNPLLKDDSDALKKVRAKELDKARMRVGAHKNQIVIEPREWEAIQAGAISTSKLNQIINNSNVDVLKKLATPRLVNVMTPQKMAIARARLASGFTQADVAESLGISVSTLTSALRKDEGG